MISHKYDTSCLYLTFPELYEIPDPISDFSTLLDEVAKQLYLNSSHAPENMIPFDQTNRNAIGKILVEVQSLKHFHFYNNIFVRITCNPYVLHTRKILDSMLDFQQRFFIPVNNHFNTLKIEVINLLNDGWFREHMKE